MFHLPGGHNGPSMDDFDRLLRKYQNDGYDFQSKDLEWGIRYVGTKKSGGQGPLGLGMLSAALGSSHKLLIGWFEGGNPPPEQFQEFLIDAEKFCKDAHGATIVDAIIAVTPEKFDKKLVSYLLDRSDEDVVKRLEFKSLGIKRPAEKEGSVREPPHPALVEGARSIPSLQLDLETLQKTLPQPTDKERVVYAWEVFPEKPLGPGQAILVATQERGLLVRRVGADHFVDGSFKWDELSSEPRAEVDNAGSSIRLYDGSREHRLRHKDAEFIAALIHHLKWAREGFVTGHLQDLGFDPELVSKCSKDIAEGRYREAVSNAFYVLEARIRRESMARSTVEVRNLVDHAFQTQNGAIPVGIDAGEREGVYFLFKGAFQAFRNSATHRDLLGESSRATALSQLALVNLLLRLTHLGKEQFERTAA
jgi:uncharacterized protein (TIGR02391 family)